MKHLSKLQLVGPTTLMIALLASEVAAHALAYAPTSEALWYINVTIFGIFQKSRNYFYDFLPYDARDYIPIVSAQLFFVIAPIFLIACLGFALRKRLLLALASNLSFLCTASLLFLWYADERQSQQASLVIMAALQGPNLYVLTLLVGATLLSFLVSHILYVRACRNRTA